MALYEFIRASALSDEERIDGIAAGELQAWRVAADGEVWFKRSKHPMILGIPKDDPNAIAAPAFADDLEADDDDGECECILIDEFGNVEAAGTVPPMHLPATGAVEFPTDDE